LCTLVTYQNYTAFSKEGLTMTRLHHKYYKCKIFNELKKKDILKSNRY
jgi:hypothetical protein